MVQPRRLSGIAGRPAPGARPISPYGVHLAEMTAALALEVDQGHEHLVVPATVAAPLNAYPSRKGFSQVQVLDQAGRQGQLGRLLVGDAELQFRGGVDRYPGIRSKRCNIFTPQVKPRLA